MKFVKKLENVQLDDGIFFWRHSPLFLSDFLKKELKSKFNRTKIKNYIWLLFIICPAITKFLALIAEQSSLVSNLS